MGLVVYSLFLSSLAQAAIIDFEDVEFGEVNAVVLSESGGFKFEATSTDDLILAYRNDGFCAGGGCTINGTASMGLYNGDQTPNFELLMSATDGRAFNLLSIDFTELFKFQVEPNTGINLIGTLAQGGTVTEFLALDQIPETFQTSSVQGFGMVTSVLFQSQTYFIGFDNIEVSEVSAPATFAFLVMGFLGLRLRKK